MPPGGRISAAWLGGCPPGRSVAVQSMLTADIPAARKIGDDMPKRWDMMPESIGPMKKPSPNAMPIMANDLARSFDDVLSAIYACAIDRLPAVMPSRMRAAKI